MAGVVTRSMTSVMKGTTNKDQLLDEKVKRISQAEEIKEAFGIGDIPSGSYDEKTGELRFNAKVLTDGDRKYAITDISIG